MPDLRLRFGEFALDQRNACLWHGSEALKLKPKAFAVLHYLLEHSGQLVSKDDLWQAIWPDVAVTDGVLAVCLTEIRQALGDDAKNPRYIETVHRRRCRFIAEVVSSQHSVVSGEEQSTSEPSLESSVQSLESNGPSLASSVQSLESETQEGSLSSDQTLDPRLSDARLSDPRPQTLDASPLLTPRSWSIRSLVFMSLTLLVGVILTVQYLSLSVPSTQPPTPNPSHCRINRPSSCCRW